MNKRNKKIALWGVIILVVILCVPLSYAAYTSVTSARRVVSTANAADSLFSSNYLALLPKTDMGDKNAASPNYKYKNIPVSYQEGNTTQAVYVSVCNYAQGYLTKWSDKDINYYIDFSLVDLENHQKIDSSQTYTDKGGKTVSGADILNQSFTVTEGIATAGKENIPSRYTGKVLKSEASNVSQNMYTIFLDTKYADIVGVKIEVFTENDSPAYSTYGLGGVLCLSGYASATASGWNGEIQEAPASGQTSTKDPEDYTGFNYEVSGSGSGTVTVTWEKEKFAISKIFLEDMKGYITSNNSADGSITFKVGEDDEDDRFFIQFYRVSQPDENEDWKTLGFKCNFTESTGTTDGE